MSFVRGIDWGEGFVKSFLEAGRACFRWRHPDLGLAAAPGDPPGALTNAPTIALLVSSTSRNSGYDRPQDYLLLHGSLRSFLQHASGRTDIRLLIAYDQGDRWFETHHHELRRLCLLQFQEAARGAAVPDDAVQIRCVDNPSGSNPVFAWNVLFQIAHQQGLDYCLQLGDDVTCLTRDWDVRLLQALRRSDNWGVAGGWNGNDDIITQAFVHTASHTQLFGALYPSSLRNWGSDTWIDHAYRSVPGLRHWLRDEVKMRNGIWADTGSADCNRYQIAPDWEAVLAVVLKDGRDRIAEHFESTLATPVMAVCTTASRSDVHSLELFARSLRLFEPAVALLVGTRVADQDFLHSWCESRRELGIQVLPAHAPRLRPHGPPLNRCLRVTADTASRALAAYENVLHLGVQSLFTAPLTSMPRRGTIGRLPRFLRRKFRRWGPFFEPRCLFLARPRSLPADGSDAVPHEPSPIPFELPESYNVSADRLLKSCHGSKAFQGGLQLTYNGVRVRTIEAPFAAARSPQETEFIRQCLQNLAHCEVPILSSLGDLLRDTDRRLIRAA